MAGGIPGQRENRKMAVSNSRPLLELVFHEEKSPSTSDWVFLPEATEEEMRSGEYFLLNSLGELASGGRCQVPPRGL
jgi:hypothetical protein